VDGAASQGLSYTVDDSSHDDSVGASDRFGERALRLYDGIDAELVCNATSACMSRLEAFQDKVAVKLGSVDPAFAELLINAAQTLIDAVSP